MKKLTIRLIASIVLLGLVMCSFSCGGLSVSKPKSDEVQAKQTEQALQEANRQIGMPTVNNFQQRKLMKMIYELSDREDLICYAYLQSQMTGKLIYMGKCIGYGLPFSAQFTNPEKVVHQETFQGGSFGTLPQADPNGLFMPTSSSATWLIMIDPAGGEPRPVYFEPTIVVSPFPLIAGVESGVEMTTTAGVTAGVTTGETPEKVSLGK